jgi:hypothetical protein
MAKTEKQLPQTPNDKQHKGDKDNFDQKNRIPDFQHTPPPPPPPPPPSDDKKK